MCSTQSCLLMGTLSISMSQYFGEIEPKSEIETTLHPLLNGNTIEQEKFRGCEVFTMLIEKYYCKDFSIKKQNFAPMKNSLYSFMPL